MEDDMLVDETKKTVRLQASSLRNELFEKIL